MGKSRPEANPAGTRQVNHYPREAKKFLEVAQREFQKGKAGNDPVKIREAAEKGWNAVVQATNGLFAEKRLPVPKTNRQRREALERLAPELRDKFEAQAHSLHAECFYDGVCPLPLVEKDLVKVREYITLIQNK